jgi:hypothetical protein
MARTQEFIPVVGEQDVDDLLPVSSSDVYCVPPFLFFPPCLVFLGGGEERGGTLGAGWVIGGFFF